MLPSNYTIFYFLFFCIIFLSLSEARDQHSGAALARDFHLASLHSWGSTPLYEGTPVQNRLVCLPVPLPRAFAGGWSPRGIMRHLGGARMVSQCVPAGGGILPH